MIELINGDCMLGMDKLITRGVRVNAIITDPPYNISKKNNFKTMGRSGVDFGEWDKNFDLLSWIDKGVQLLDKNGSMFIFNDWKNLGNIARYAENKGMVIKDMFRWKKTNPMPRNRDRRYVTDYETAVWLVKKGAKWTFNRQSDGYERPEFVCGLVQGKEKTEHTTQKPLKLMDNIIKIHTNKGDVVLDPFMGSGSTLVSCKNLNRNGIGIEIDKKKNKGKNKNQSYFDISVERVNNVELKRWNVILKGDKVDDRIN